MLKILDLNHLLPNLFLNFLQLAKTLPCYTILELINSKLKTWNKNKTSWMGWEINMDFAFEKVFPSNLYCFSSCLFTFHRNWRLSFQIVFYFDSQTYHISLFCGTMMPKKYFILFWSLLWELAKYYYIKKSVVSLNLKLF